MRKGKISLIVLGVMVLFTISLSARTFTINAGSGICPGVWGLNSVPNGGGWCGSATISVPDNWQAARIWGRFQCNTSTGFCASGDCGYKIACSGATGVPPVTLAEFTLQGAGGLDYYDGSLVDGYNVNMSIANNGGTKSGNGTKYDCGAPVCNYNITAVCPAELQYKNASGAVIACFSACMKFNTDAFCCRGAYGTPTACAGTSWARWFKSKCPDFYSYAYDDTSSTYTCIGGNYTVTIGSGVSSSSSTSTSSSSTSSTSSSSGVTTITSGSIYYIKAQCSGKNMDVAGGSTVNGAKVQQYTASTSTAQRWKITDMGNGLQFKNWASGKMLQVSGGSTGIKNGAKLISWTDSGSVAFRWGAQHMGGGWWKFWSAGNGALVIDVPGASTANSVQLQIATDNGGAAQRWSLTKY